MTDHTLEFEMYERYALAHDLKEYAQKKSVSDDETDRMKARGARFLTDSARNEEKMEVDNAELIVLKEALNQSDRDVSEKLLSRVNQQLGIESADNVELPEEVEQ